MSLFKKMLAKNEEISNRKILVVDDELDLCEMIEVTLNHVGFKTKSVHDGQAALKELQTYNPNLIILDIHMPKMNGQQVLAELIKKPETKDIPVIVVTSLTAQEKISDEEWADRMEVAGFISKPFDPEQLVEKIKQILE